MIRRIWFAIGLLGAAVGFAPAVSAQPAKDATVRVGMAKTFFNDIPEPVVIVATQPFPDLMKETTGLQGELSTKDGPLDVARRLDAGELQIGVFHGHELAWAQQKYPKLTPLLIVSNKLHEVRVSIIVPKDSPAKSMADLRGKNLDLPLGSKEHTCVFVERKGCNNALPTPKQFFSKVTRSKNANIALDDVCNGKTDAVAVDSVSLDYYVGIKGPRFYKNLRVLQESAPFPQPVLAYKPGAVSAETIEQFRKGLLTAHKLPMGRDMMDMWKIDRFDEVPATYAKSLAEVLKEYPLGK